MRFFEILIFVGAVATQQAFGFTDQGLKINLNNLGVPTLIPTPNVKPSLVRVLGGTTVTKLTDIPSMVAIYSIDKAGNVSFCGGSLINYGCVLTAAHCLHNKLASNIYMGMTNLETADSFVKMEVNQSSYIIHKSYNTITNQNDIALIKLPRKVASNAVTKPIALTIKNDNVTTFDGLNAAVFGWGLTSNELKLSTTLQTAAVKILSNKECAKVYGTRLVTDNIICQNADSMKGTCQGDSGGPLVYTRNNKKELIGITSYGSSKGCANTAPRAFVRVSKYLDWIANNCKV